MSNSKRQAQVRRAHPWTLEKLEFLEKYIPGFLTACNTSWYTCYVDGFAGSGINLDPSTDISRNGSAIIALNALGQPPQKKEFDTFHFVEFDTRTAEQLWRRVDAHPKSDRVKRYQADFNLVIPDILADIHSRTPTLFLLDPEDLSLHWNSVKLIGQREKADVFVLVSASGVSRNINNPAAHPRITEFFGSNAWLSVKNQLEGGEMPGYSAFSAFLDLYTEQLRSLGFTMADYKIIARNSKNAPMHGLVFASKHRAALRIANDILKGITERGQEPLRFL